MDQHVNVIGIIEIVLGALAALGGVAVMLLAAVGGAAISSSSPDVPQGVAGLIAAAGFGIGLFIIVIGALEIFAGINLRQHKSWARIVIIVLGALGLLSFPIGTALGIYILWALLNKETVQLFEQKSAE